MPAPFAADTSPFDDTHQPSDALDGAGYRNLFGQQQQLPPQVMEADTALTRHQLDAIDALRQYKSLRRRDAVEGFAGFKQALQSSRDAVQQDLSPQAKALLKPHLDSTYIDSLQVAQDHQLRQDHAWSDQSSLDSMRANLQEALLHRDDANKVQQLADHSSGEWLKIGERKGWSDQLIGQQAMQTKAQLFGQVIQAQLQDGRPDQAQAYYDQAQHQLDPDTMQRMVQSLRPLMQQPPQQRDDNRDMQFTDNSENNRYLKVSQPLSRESGDSKGSDVSESEKPKRDSNGENKLPAQQPGNSGVPTKPKLGIRSMPPPVYELPPGWKQIPPSKPGDPATIIFPDNTTETIYPDKDGRYDYSSPLQDYVPPESRSFGDKIIQTLKGAARVIGGGPKPDEAPISGPVIHDPDYKNPIPEFRRHSIPPKPPQHQIPPGFKQVGPPKPGGNIYLIAPDGTELSIAPEEDGTYDYSIIVPNPPPGYDYFGDKKPAPPWIRLPDWLRDPLPPPPPPLPPGSTPDPGGVNNRKRA